MNAPLGEAQCGGVELQVGVALFWQQLVRVLQQALPFFGATQWAQSFLGAQLALPLAFTLQQMMNPGFPQTDFAAHF